MCHGSIKFFEFGLLRVCFDHSRRLLLSACRVFIVFIQVHPRLPPNLLRASEVLVVEAPSGVRANVLRFLMGIPKDRISKRPVERSR